MSQVILPPDSALYAAFTHLINEADRVFFSGIPGVGKSLLLQQLALMARDAGRPVCLAQWDTARQPFELPEYPLEKGATHPLVIQATGLWLRQAIADWEAERRSSNAMLIGEAPLIGGRLMQLATPIDDAAESLLANPATQFIIPVPSAKVRQIIEAKRERSIQNPQHEYEAHDAPPDLLRQLWRDLFAVAVDLGLAESIASPPYQPAVYAAVYQHLLRRRQTHVLHLQEPLQSSGSVYADLAHIPQLSSAPDDARRILNELESQISPAQLRAKAAQWHRV